VRGLTSRCHGVERQRLAVEHIRPETLLEFGEAAAVVNMSLGAGSGEFAGQDIGADQRNTGALTSDRRAAVGGVADEPYATRRPPFHADLGRFVEIEIRRRTHRRKYFGYHPALTADAADPVDGPGFFYAPTLLTNVDPDSEVAQDELFGPVLVVIPYSDDDAVRIANNSIFGLSGGVYGADTDRAMSVARRIRTGTVGVNGGVWFAPDAPFGGYKQSGIGREMGVAGLAEFLETKTIAVPAG